MSFNRMWGKRFPEYISVAERKESIEKQKAKLKKRGQNIKPIIITGRSITTTFWGKAWCKHLEAYSDYENRLPRGRSYVRNGAVIDLAIDGGVVEAQVQGSRLYMVSINITPYSPKSWHAIVKQCTGKIDTMVELLQGKLSRHVMEIMINAHSGLFPEPHEITIKCSCPDYASLCKHSAAVLYGIGARLDEYPEHLFKLRCVDHTELIDSSYTADDLATQSQASFDDTELSALFDIELDDTKKSRTKKRATKKKAAKKPISSASKKKPPKKRVQKKRKN